MNPEVLTYEPRGAMRIFNWYLYTYLLSAAALFLGARWLSKTDERIAGNRPSMFLPAAGVIVLFFLLNIEIADFYATGPTIMFRFGATVSQDLTYTIGWLVFGMALLASGIYVRNPAGENRRRGAHRRDDLQVFSLRSVVARGASPDRIVRRPRDLAGARVACAAEVRAIEAGETGMTRAGISVAIVCGAAGVMISAQAQTPEDRLPYERRVVTVGMGPQRLAVDAPLLIHGARFRVVRSSETSFAEGGLSDLRLFADGARPIPYLLIRPAAGEARWNAGKLLPITATKKTSGLEVDLGEAQSIDRIRVEGLPVPYLKRLSLEGSGDRARWTMLAAEGTLFDLPDEGLRQDTLGFTAGPYRYLRLTWNDTNSGRVPMPRAVAARLASRIPPPAPTTIDAPVESRPSEPGTSRYRIRLPAPAMPIVALDLDVGGGHVYRRAVVAESRFEGNEARPVELGTARLVRVTRDGITASALRIPISAPSEAEIELAIDDGANAPLDLRRVSIVLAQLPWIYFEAPPGVVTARYGDAALARPAYDLEAVRESVEIAKVPEASWGDPQARVERPADAPATPMPATGAALDKAGFRYSRSIRSSAPGLVALPLDAHALVHSLGPQGRFADMRVIDGSSRQVPYIVERRNEPLSIDLAVTPASAVQAQGIRASGSRQQSVYVVALPYRRLPPATLVVETSGRVFQRTVRLGLERPPDRQRRDAWFDVRAGATWQHADEHTAARPLTLRVDTIAEKDLLLVVDEGDNAPLPIASLRLLLPSYRLRFYQPVQAPLTLAYGRDDLQPPQYDLALLARRVMGAMPSEVIADEPQAGASAEDRSFVSPTAFWAILGVAVVVLLGLIARLISGNQPAQTR